MFFSHSWLRWYSPKLLSGGSTLDQRSCYSCEYMTGLVTISLASNARADLRALSSGTNLTLTTPGQPGDELNDYENIRRSWVREQMRKRRDEYCERQPITLRIGSFNVNGRDPSGSLSNFVRRKPSGEETASGFPDLYVFGFQELDLSGQALLYQPTTRKEELWMNAITEALGSAAANYVKVSPPRNLFRHAHADRFLH